MHYPHTHPVFFFAASHRFSRPTRVHAALRVSYTKELSDDGAHDDDCIRWLVQHAKSAIANGKASV